MRKTFNRFLCMVLALTLLMASSPVMSSAGNVDSFKVDKGTIDSIQLKVGDTTEITASYTDTDYDDMIISWVDPKNGEIAEIAGPPQLSIDKSNHTKTSTVTVKAVRAGYLSLTARIESDDGKWEASKICKIIVSETGGLTLKPSKEGAGSAVEAGKTMALTLTPPEGSAIKSVEWSSSDEDIATVNPASSSNPADDGTFSTVVTGVKAGKAVISADAKMSDDTTKSAAYEITVPGSGGTTTKDPITSIEIVAASTPVTIEKGEERKISAVVSPYGSTEKIKWSVSDTNIATIDNDPSDPTKAIVKGIAPGNVTISAENTDGKVKAPIKLTLTVSGITLSLRNPGKPITAGSTAQIIITRYGTATENDLNSDDWNWESDNPIIANALASGPSMGQIIAREPGSATITCESESGSYSDKIKVTVVSPTSTATNVSISNNRINFSSIMSQLKSKCNSETNSSLRYITNLSVPTEQGTLYYGYVSSDNTGSGVATSNEYYVSPSNGQLDLSKITFIPQKDYSGDILISYTGYSTVRTSYAGLIASTVTSTTSSRISYDSRDGSPIRFQSSDFSRYCQTINAHELESVSFTAPASRYGLFYYSYTNGAGPESNVTSGQTFYRTKSPSIDKLYFVPDEDYEGSFSISFKGRDTTGAELKGSVYINVGSRDSSEDPRLTYYCQPGENVYFSSSDFSDASYDETGNQYSYVRFKQPDSHGTLYYDDGDREVSYSTHFYRTGSRNRLDEVFFEADKNYTGTVYIPYICYDTDGETFSGDVTIKVSKDADKDEDSITYSCSYGGSVYFDSDDFSEFSYDKTNRQISYVRFNQPSSSRGTLYYDDDRRVSSGTSFYRSSESRLIDDVYFDANSGYNGTVSIPFTGYNTNGNSFSGTVKIKVGTSASDIDDADAETELTITYDSDGTGVTFRTFDFTTACASALSTPLSYVKITEPPEEFGKLYLNYSSPASYSSFDPSLIYSITGTPEISRITFVPRADYIGTFSLSYVGTGTGGDTCSGTIRIKVTHPSSSAYFDDMWQSVWAIPSVDFMKRYNIVEGTSEHLYSPNDPMRRGDYVLMLDRIFKFSDTSSGAFLDVPEDSYYASAVNAARVEGIIEGGLYFYPNSVITREKAAKYLYNSLNSIGHTVPTSSYSNIYRFSDAELASPDAVEALSAMVQLGVFVGDDNGKLNPTLALNRAQLAVILHRALTFT